VAWAVAKLALDFPASFPDVATTEARDLGLRELLAAHPWVTAPVFERAVYLVRWKHQGPFLPAPALFLDYCQAAADDLERQQREQEARLPAPAPPTDDERRAEDDRNEAAKAAAWASLPPRLRGKWTPPGPRGRTT
jgi:hypothetical protein